MYAMQYEIPLPADYDMSIIRERVATRGAALDRFPGLGLKAYLIRERGRHGSQVNQYAPFYLWSAMHGMRRFLFQGGGFGGVVASFGRPPVRHWTGLTFRKGPSSASVPMAALRSITVIAPDVDPRSVAEEAESELARRALVPGVHSTATAIDPARWELLHFTLWEKAPHDAQGAIYEVLHLSQPEIGELSET